MKDSRGEYRHILKATSIFGGVQFFNIFISIAKSKIIAILIGASGLGILGILTSTLSLILGVSRMGLDFSSVKEISASKTNIDTTDVSRKVTITKRLTWLTGAVGALIVLVASPLLSQIAFKNQDFTFYFIIISIAVLFNQLTIGNMAILQGFNALKKIAKSSVLASFFALIFASCIYYFFGQKGIPWVIVISAITTFLFSRYYASQLGIQPFQISFKASIVEGKNMLRLGIVLSLGTLISLLNAYLVQIFITNQGNLEQVGLYNAGFILISSYVLLFFNALSKDFFPKLSQVASNNLAIKRILNQQAITTLLLLTPIIVLFLVFKSLIVRLLYTEEFLPILGMISFGIVSTIFKAISWILGFVIIVKNDSKLYVVVELISNLVLFFIIVIGYQSNGLTGVGIGYLVYYMIYVVLIKFIVSKKYDFSFNKDLIRVMIISVVVCFATLYLVYLEASYLKWVFLGICIIASITYTLVMLNRLVGIKGLFKK